MALMVILSDTMEIISTRDFAAPRETLFQVFADPAELALWWGPKGFTNTITQFDFRSGGAWRFTMHGPDGTDYPNAKDFIEVEKPGRIVFQHLDPKHRFTMTMSFEPLGNIGGTRLTWRMLFDPNEENLQNYEWSANLTQFGLDNGGNDPCSQLFGSVF